MINTESLINNINGIQPIESEITSRSSDLIATPLMVAIWEKAVEIDRLVKTQDKALTDLKNKLKEFMGNAEVLISPTGEEMVTWKQAADRLELNKDALKLNYADIYDICCEVKAGNRAFLLK